MAYLLDTSVFLSAVIAPDRLNRRAQQLLAEQSETLFLSAASSWEIGIKYALGRLRIPDAPARWVMASMRRLGAHPLDIAHRHALDVVELPQHHQDPFDRILIAQAKNEDLILLTTDRIFQKYPIEVVFCRA
jgi:PIN domain nuclease of toxin-antitoxin system